MANTYRSTTRTLFNTTLIFVRPTSPPTTAWAAPQLLFDLLKLLNVPSDGADAIPFPMQRTVTQAACAARSAVPPIQ